MVETCAFVEVAVLNVLEVDETDLDKSEMDVVVDVCDFFVLEKFVTATVTVDAGIVVAGITD